MNWCICLLAKNFSTQDYHLDLRYIQKLELFIASKLSAKQKPYQNLRKLKHNT